VCLSPPAASAALCRQLFPLLALTCLAAAAVAEERHESFDQDPGWEGVNNRAREPGPRTVKQDFGYSASTSHAGGTPGEVGGLITPAAEPAYYAKTIAAGSFEARLRASGKVLCKGPRAHVLIGFFNADTLNEWRTPNTIALRLAVRGDRVFAFVEYATARWRAGGDSPRPFPTARDPKDGRERPRGFPAGKAYDWSLEYDPKGDGGRGAITATFGGETAVCHLGPGHRGDGAAFNRFGLLTVMKHADDPGEVWLDDVTVNGDTEDFAADPGWEGHNNRRTYQTDDVRPRFDFGFSPTNYAGGDGKGELGGLVFRGDCRFPARMACYGDRLGALTLDKPLRASGKVCLRRGVSDSTTLLGFYHARDSMAVTDSQAHGTPRCFLGVAVEGPSRDGFLFYPTYRVSGDGGSAVGNRPPPILPDGRPHAWALEYDPAAAGGRGRVTVTLDRQAVTLDLGRGHRSAGARFDRFGLVTTWIDGNGQKVYFDDLTYTARQE
jgi:hypothetical protein